MAEQSAMSSSKTGAVLITGISGYLGVLVASKLLYSDGIDIVGIVRDLSKTPAILSNIELELSAIDPEFDRSLLKQVRFVELSDIVTASTSGTEMIGSVRDIVHCAGCVDYFAIEELHKANVEYTEKMLALAKMLDVERFIFMSTAYSCGYIDGAAKENLHGEPEHGDPTEYTKSKRMAEHLVAASGVPYLILRPSILIGDSVTGRYSGKRYGLYQQWMGLERLLCNKYHEDFHTVAPQQPLNLLHQDSFQNAFYASYKHAKQNAIVHLVSDTEQAPTMRDLWDLWLNAVFKPQTVYYYDRFDDVPLKNINIRQRAYLTFAEKNLEIGSHHWCFENSILRSMMDGGMNFRHATIQSVNKCQDLFVTTSAATQSFLEKYKTLLSTVDVPHVIDVPVGSSLDGNITDKNEVECNG